jgi:hypothetical protein
MIMCTPVNTYFPTVCIQSIRTYSSEDEAATLHASGCALHIWCVAFKDAIASCLACLSCAFARTANRASNKNSHTAYQRSRCGYLPGASQCAAPPQPFLHCPPFQLNLSPCSCGCRVPQPVQRPRYLRCVRPMHMLPNARLEGIFPRCLDRRRLLPTSLPVRKGFRCGMAPLDYRCIS